MKRAYNIALLCFAVAVFGGCTSTSTSSSPVDVAAWTRQRDEIPYHAPRLRYCGIAVTEFDWKYQSLDSWQRSRDLIGSALAAWFAVPESRQHLLTNPDEEDLERFFTTSLPALVQTDEILLIYLGTHHLRDGRILVGREQSIQPAKLTEWLARVDNRTILLADVCYGDQLEQEAEFNARTTRIYASNAKEPAIDLRFKGPNRAARQFFAETRAIIDRTLMPDTHEFSLFGFILVDSLRRELARTPSTIGIDAVWETLRSSTRAYARRTKQMIPEPRVRNLVDTRIAGKDALAINTYDLLAAFDGSVSFEEGMYRIAKVYRPGIDTAKYRAQLDEIEQELSMNLAGADSTAAKVEAMNACFYKNRKWSAIDEPYPDDFLLHRVLETGRGRCASLSAAYLVMAERLKLPLKAACLPEHMFVRWDAENHVNIETTKAGAQIDDQEYRKTRKWGETQASNAFYLKSLSTKEALATYLVPLGDILRKRGRSELAVQLLLHAVKINTGDAEGWNNLGLAHAAMGKRQLAKAAYSRALKVNPLFAEAWNNIGNIEREPDAKIHAYQRAVAIKPGLSVAWRNLSYAWYEKRNYAMALTAAKRADKLGLMLKPTYIQLLEKLNSEHKE